MVRYSRKFKGLGEVAAMEKSAETTTAEAAVGRKRKIGLGETEVAESSVQLKTRRLAVVKPEDPASPARSGDSTCESASSDRGLASCCSSNGMNEMANGDLKSVDLEDEASLYLLPTSADDLVDFRDRRETTPSSGGRMDSTARSSDLNPRRRPPQSKMPSEAELEEFFSSAEKDLQKEFIDKYNFDIVKDEPLEGRYEWVEIRP